MIKLKPGSGLHFLFAGGTCFAVFAVFATMVAILTSSPAEAATSRRADAFMKPQVGVWFGPCAPMGKLNEAIDPALGGGVFFRRNTAWSLLKLGAEISYQKHESNTLNSLSLMPVYANAVFLLPIKFPINFQLKLGAGAVNVTTKPDDKSQFDPLFMTGIEASFPAGKIINFGMRVDYMMIREKQYSGSTMNGYVLNVGLTLYFNL